MSKTYTVSEFAAVLSNMANRDVDVLCDNTIKAVRKTFLDEVVKRTPEGVSGSYNDLGDINNPRFTADGNSKSTTGLKQGWEDNRDSIISKSPRIYRTVLTNKAKSTYTSGYTGSTRTDYYADYVDRGHRLAKGYKPFLDAYVKGGSVKGKKFTDTAIRQTYIKVNALVEAEIEKWLNEVL